MMIGSAIARTCPAPSRGRALVCAPIEGLPIAGLGCAEGLHQRFGTEMCPKNVWFRPGILVI